MWQHADVPRSDVPHPLITPSGTDPYYTMSVWHVEECRHMQVTYTTPSINPSGTEPYYTMSVSHMEQCRHTQVRCTPPANWTQCYRALLHHVSLICGRMQMYPGQMYTPTQVIEPSPTEPCCTMSVWHVAACTCTPNPQPVDPYSGGEEYYIMACFCLLHRYVWNAKIGYKQMFYFSFYFIPCED